MYFQVDAHMMPIKMTGCLIMLALPPLPESLREGVIGQPSL
jgi:hypothetical protein